MVNRLKAFLPALILAFVLGSAISTQVILANVEAMGLEVPLDIRMSTTLEDIAGMASTYLMLIAVAFILAFPVAGWLTKRLSGQRTLLFMIAGFTAVAVLNLALTAALGIHVLPATRTLPGLLGQCLAGAAGGGCYGWLRNRQLAGN